MVAAALVLALTPACGDKAHTTPVTSAAAPTGSPSASAVPAPSSSPRREDPRWRAALDGDEARAAELGNDVGVVELAAALNDEDAIRAIALRALPHAGDRDGALGALAAALDHARSDEAAVADAIERVIQLHRRDVEVPSREGARACATALQRIASSGGRGALDPSRAESLSRRLED